MKLTVKCPNCGGQNEPDDVFCTTCGVKLSHEPDHFEEKPAGGATMYCSRNPREHVIKNPGLDFCPICGATLVDAMPEIDPNLFEPSQPGPENPEPPAEPPESEPMGPESPTPKFAPRTCRNGHTYYDPVLTFCPECGLPFEEESIPTSPEPTPPDSPRLPDGMYLPSDDDLIRK